MLTEPLKQRPGQNVVSGGKSRSNQYDELLLFGELNDQVIGAVNVLGYNLLYLHQFLQLVHQRL